MNKEMLILKQIITDIPQYQMNALAKDLYPQTPYFELLKLYAFDPDDFFGNIWDIELKLDDDEDDARDDFEQKQKAGEIEEEVEFFGFFDAWRDYVGPQDIVDTIEAYFLENYENLYWDIIFEKDNGEKEVFYWNSVTAIENHDPAGLELIDRYDKYLQLYNNLTNLQNFKLIEFKLNYVTILTIQNGEITSISPDNPKIDFSESAKSFVQKLIYDLKKYKEQHEKNL